MTVMGDDPELEGLSHDELLRLGVARFNARQFFEAHEAWEEVWLEATREMRPFYQGLIQVAAAFVHLQRNEYPGTVRLLDEGLRKLAAYASPCEGVDLTSLIVASRDARDRIVAAGEHHLRSVDPASLPMIRIVDPDADARAPSHEGCSGTEPNC